MRIFAGFFLLHFIFISSTDCSSSCKPRRHKHDEIEGNDKSFKHLNGSALEEAVIDEILLKKKSNPRVQVRHFEITRITRNMLRNFTDILSIDFRSNEIEDIENESFSECTKLEKIDLMENRLAEITKHIFSGNFGELQEINLSFNAIIGIESGSFDKLGSLKSIDLSDNCIHHLHSDLFKKCDGLKFFHLRHNNIIKIEFNLFDSKTHLTLLDLSHNHLNFIPEFEMKTIRRYNLSHNNITLLDLNYKSRERRKLAKIEQLTVAFNNISLCAETHEMRDDIIHLDVSYNAITDLNDFPLLPNLEVLIVAFNKISQIAVLDAKFPSLRELNISSNSGFECKHYQDIRNNFPHIALMVDVNLTHHCNIDDYDYYDLDAIRHHHQNITASTGEIVRQLKLNRTLLIILLSTIIIFAIFHTTFLLYQHLHGKSKAIKRSKLKKKLLIENIEL